MMLATVAAMATAAGSSYPGAMVVDCYLRTDIVPAKCGHDVRFDLFERLPNKSWAPPVTDVNCDGQGGHSVHGAPEPFGLGISLARCEDGCETYGNSTSNCTGIIVSKPFNSSCLPAHVQSCPFKQHDLCNGAPTQCSAEICDLQPGQLSRLKPGTYYHDKQIFLPQGSGIIGAGINLTYIVACGLPLASRCNLTERRGFLMGDDTYVGNFTFAGRENTRGGCSLGAGLIETPGCMGDYCSIPGKNTTGGRWGPGGDPSAHGDPLCNPPGRDMEHCVGTTNVTAEYIHLMPWTMDHVGWFPSTVPWGEDQISGSKNITLRNITTWGTWADGINFHGGHKNALVENCEISYTGDDIYAHWPQATFRPGFNNTHDPRDCSNNIIFRNNIGRKPSNGFAGPDKFCKNGCLKWSNGIRQSTGVCFSLWGSGSNMAIIDNHCEETRDGDVGFHPSYTNTRNIQMWCSEIAVAGNTYSNGGSCNTTACQPNEDKTVCKTQGSWPTNGTIGEDQGCNASAALPSGYRQRLWKGFPSVAFPQKRGVPLAEGRTPLQCSNQTLWWTDRSMTSWDAPLSVTFPDVASPSDCCAMCGRNASCNAWTYWHKNGNACELAPFATIGYTSNVTSGSTTPPTWQPPVPQPPLPTTGECHYVLDTVYDKPLAGDKWTKKIETTSAGQCCAICRTLPACLVSNYEPEPWTGDVNGACTMRGQVNLSRPTHVPNATACIVKTRPPPPLPTPPHAMNVLYIVSDDARPEMPSFGQDYVKAPNLAALSARGLTFMNAYCQQSICSPSRNSFMSGKRPQNTRVWNFINDFRQEFPFHQSFPQYFKGHNYSTSGHGKLYHPDHPKNFDEPLSWSQNASSAENPSTSYPYYKRDSGKSKDCGYFDVCPTGNGTSASDPKLGGRDQFVDHHTVTEVMGTMDAWAKDARRPFFIGVGLIRPHLPFIVPEDTWAQYNDSDIKLPKSLYPPVNVANISLNDQVFQGTHKFCPDGTDIATDCPSVERRTLPTDTGISPFQPFDAENIRFLRHGYYAAITFMDEQVGRLLDHLKLLGQTQNTIVIFHGDHGWHLGEQGLWTKKTCFELGARVPLIIAAPQLTASHGKRTSQMAELVDLYPTVAELAGLPSPPDVDGASLMPAFLDPTAPAGAKDYAFSEFPQCPSDPKTNLWHTERGCQNVAREQIKFFGFSIRSASFRYTEWHPWSPQLKADWNTMTGVELYDYRSVDMTDFDQFDRVNVADAPEHAAAQAELAAALRSHYNRMVA
tara:strand:+ start:151 stop:3924 length:3774 start_codon:yes stop_codon:yes gene_type:complete